jgi:hypothetical protein
VKVVAKGRSSEDVRDYADARQMILDAIPQGEEEAQIDVGALPLVLQNKLLLMARARKQRFLDSRRRNRLKAQEVARS